MSSAVYIDSFSTSIDDLTRKQQGDMVTVLRCLARDKMFSAFDASANQTIARTITRLLSGGYVKDIGGGYPWTKVEITEKGLDLIWPMKASDREGK